MERIQIDINPWNENTSRDSWSINIPASLLRDLMAAKLYVNEFNTDVLVLEAEKVASWAFEIAGVFMAERAKREAT